MNEQEARRRLREWVASVSGRVKPEEVADQTPILEKRLIRSLHVPDLLLLIEELRGQPVDPARLQPGSLRDIDTIWRNFLADRPA